MFSELCPPFLFDVLFMAIVLGIYAGLDELKKRLKEKARKKRW